MIENCKNCKYAVEHEETDQQFDEEELAFIPVPVFKLRCHRYAPRMIAGAGTGWADWEWPEIKKTDWCGEWVWLPREG